MATRCQSATIHLAHFYLLLGFFTGTFCFFCCRFGSLVAGFLGPLRSFDMVAISAFD